MVGGGNKQPVNYGVGDEISYAFGSGLLYGEVIRLLEGGAAVEIQFEDGRREIKKSRDRALHLVRRATGASELDERNAERSQSRDTEIDDVRRSDVRRRW
ncbi:MAG: hypothetical protein ACKV2V_27585 [Blastocatellia bacterium]